MKKIGLLLVTSLLLLTGCTDPEEETFKMKIESVVKDATATFGKENIALSDNREKEEQSYFIGLNPSGSIAILLNISDDKEKVTQITAATTLDAYALGGKTEMLNAFQLLFRSVNPDLSVGQRQKIMNELDIDISTDFMTIDKNTTFDNVYYKIIATDSHIFLSASPL